MKRFSMFLVSLAFLGGIAAAPPAFADPGPAPGATPSPASTPAPNLVFRPGFELAAGVWSPSLGGSVGNNNQTVNVNSLGLNNSSSAAIDFSYRNRHATTFTVGYTSLNSAANATLNQAFQINGVTFNTADNVSSSVNYSTIDLTWEPRLVGDVNSQLNFLFLVKVLSLQGNFVDVTQGLNESINQTVPVPMIGLSGWVTFTREFGAYGRIGYIGGNISGTNATLLDYRGGLKYEAGDWGLSADYRSFSLNGTVSNSNNVNLQFSGPAFEASYHF